MHGNLHSIFSIIHKQLPILLTIHVYYISWFFMNIRPLGNPIFGKGTIKMLMYMFDHAISL